MTGLIEKIDQLKELDAVLYSILNFYWVHIYEEREDKTLRTYMILARASMAIKKYNEKLLPF